MDHTYEAYLPPLSRALAFGIIQGDFSNFPLGQVVPRTKLYIIKYESAGNTKVGSNSLTIIIGFTTDLILTDYFNPLTSKPLCSSLFTVYQYYMAACAN